MVFPILSGKVSPRVHPYVTPHRLGRSPRQVKVGGPVISQSDIKLDNSCSVHSRRRLFYEGALMELVFVLLASLLIRNSCSRQLRHL